MKKIPTIELTIKDEEDGVFAISLVESPAIMENFVALSKEGLTNLKAVDDDRRIVVGYALIPDREIPRKQEVNGEMKKFNIMFSKDTVAKSQELFMKNLHLQNVTSEHQKPVTDCCVIESWVTEDVKNDKINLYGLEPIEGGWAVMMKLYNDEEYEKAKNGEYKGFSIEALYDGFEQLASSHVPKIPTVKLNEEETYIQFLKDLFLDERS